MNTEIKYRAIHQGFKIATLTKQNNINQNPLYFLQPFGKRQKNDGQKKYPRTDYMTNKNQDPLIALKKQILKFSTLTQTNRNCGS